ncbi:hypothetical protein EJ08DRAFT_267201 [Tothia fuscella]|uniref:Uncharacterized protein n=1 Tax=Tothia fuscella TaxID=1048955 RepID=A0A9P4NQF6_9PEZI|nr:hypothetical protein EJ08DRAFT_267201 [Tothia fuscella]
MGGTEPSTIIQNESALGCIHSSDVWVLLTDGKVRDGEVQNLTALGQDKGVFSVATIFLITSRPTNSSPNGGNVSVGITSYANTEDALCLFKDYMNGRIYVIAAKGSFARLDAAKDHDSWNALSSFAKEDHLLAKIRELEIQVPSAETRPKSTTLRVNLGSEWNAAHEVPVVADVSLLLQAGSVSDADLNLLLNDEAVNILILVCKTRGQLAEYRNWLLNQKVEQVTIKWEDISGAGAIISQLGKEGITKAEKTGLQSQLRAAHQTNQAHYLKKVNEGAGKEIRNRNQLIDHALRQLAEFEKSGYTANILSRSSNRARRAKTTDAHEGSEAFAILNFEGLAYRNECQICCGENEVMSIVLKALTADESAANTTDFALDFPLAAWWFPANENIVSSQCICFQCAFFGLPGRSIYKESIAAVLPTLEYRESNKQYINQQLYLALNAGLKTGVPQLAQLFATILDRTVLTKEWAGAKRNRDKQEDSDIKIRREALEWMRASVIENIRCRETFNELGEWTTYPKALAWAAKDFTAEGLASWAINYPVRGFHQLTRFGEMTGQFSVAVVQDMKQTKLIHIIAFTYLSKLLKHGGRHTKDSVWTQGMLAVIYAEFNADLVPRDLGGKESLLTSPIAFCDKLAKFLSAKPAQVSGYLQGQMDVMMPRIQIIIFWLLQQRSHTSPKTFFATLRANESLAAIVLNTKAELPGSVVSDVLLSPFRNKTDFINKSAAEMHATGFIAFVNPFGASVLRCGHLDCGVSFAPRRIRRRKDKKHTDEYLDSIRAARAEHLIEAFGASKAFAGNVTGLPESTALPKAPTSTHVTMHISIARTWARLSVDQRRAVIQSYSAIDAGKETRDFVDAVRKEICSGSHRGDIFNARLDQDIMDVLPSFFKVLGEALMAEGREGGAAVYEHVFTNNTLAWKVEYELKMLEQARFI